MIINVSKNKITIEAGHTANEGEYNIRTCNFVFSEDYTEDLSKVAVFSKDGKSYKVSIVNNQCIIPIEVLEEKGTITIGVYAYSITEESGEEILEKRFSPAPAKIFMDYGSYIEDAENASHPTPTEIEQLDARISAVEIDAEQVEVNTQNITNLQTTKADKTELPTKTSDLTNDNGFIDNSVNNLINYTLTTQTGSKIDLEINSSTYELVAKLYDKNNTLISTSSTIDLPLESMVLNVEYDSTTKELVITLQSGTVRRIPLSDIIDGLVSQTDFDALELRVDTAETDIETLQGQVETLETQVADLEEQVEELEANQLTGEAEGTSIYVNDSADAKVRSIGLIGRTTQESTTQSANLFDEAYYNKDSLYTTGTYKYALTRIKGNRTLYVRAVLKDGKTAISGLYLAITTNGSNPNSGTSGFIVSNGQNATRQVDYTGYDDLYFSFYPTNTNVNTIFDTYNIMVSTDNVAYVPFVPDSPSPNYSQEIKNTGDNINLFDKTTALLNTSLASNGLPQTNEGSVTSDFMQVEENTSHYLSRVRGGNFVRTYAFYNENKELISINYISGGEDVSGAVTTPSSTKYMRVVSGTDYYEECKVEKGTQATPYSPYGCGNVNEKVQNKNLFDEKEWYNVLSAIDNTSISKQTINGIEYIKIKANNTNLRTYQFMKGQFKENTQYVISAKALRYNNETTSLGFQIDYTDGTNKSVYITQTTESDYLLVSDVNKTIDYIRLAYANNDYALIRNIQLEQGSATSYIPHAEQTISFPLAQGQKFMQGDYLADDGVHHVRKEWVLDENNISMVTNHGTGHDTYRVIIMKSSLGWQTSWTTGVCLMNRYKEETNTANLGSGKFSLNSWNQGIEIYDDRFTDLATARNLLIGTVIQIKQAQEVIDPYTEEQQAVWEQIKALRTYKPVTHISSEDETPATVNITYVRDLETVINNLS